MARNSLPKGVTYDEGAQRYRVQYKDAEGRSRVEHAGTNRQAAFCYTADAGMRPSDAVDDMAKLLASGKNVVSCSMVGLVHPTTLIDMFTKQLKA